MYVSPGVVVGFHGCDRAVFDSVIKNGSSISNSENDYDWLGHGVYFWEGSYERALNWAKQSKAVKKPAVIGAFIKLGNCIDLLDSVHLEKVKSTYEIYKIECDKLGVELPENRIVVNDISFIRELDCQVIQRLQQFNNELIIQDLNLPDMAGQNKRKVQKHPEFIDSVRGMFPEGDELYKGAGFRDKNHIQLCIVNPNCIIGFFDPIHNNNWYKSL
ncbi:hypothetical protein QL995_07650 [Pseudoalteromonas sp. APC 3358]|uniref:hypothetical protein n=1 Tax=Pseudoalteromonas sp. APC 3358 TaxID=3035176 RepID=UPI0025B54ECF|nr:hypothetical protein [Pseudoalteromonas sp. APC 3358]MDN3382543.1 hypothetical protein [Pseudoalteromonas sp. APC 3358]